MAPATTEIYTLSLHDALPISQMASEKLKALEAERRTLLSTLLGPDWESSYYPYPAHPDTPPLDGPILGALPPQTKQAVRDIRSEEHTSELQSQFHLVCRLLLE